jgi:hypothetical protein
MKVYVKYGFFSAATTGFARKEGKPSAMPQEHIQVLVGIGFNWGTSKTALASIRSVQLQQLCKFKAEFGHCRAPQRYAANPKLGYWVDSAQQLQVFRKESQVPYQVTEEHIREVESVGFEWVGDKQELLQSINDRPNETSNKTKHYCNRTKYLH